MSERIFWNAMGKEQRLTVLNYVITLAKEEKKFGDAFSLVMKKELKRIDSLSRYHGRLPVLFHDDFGISVEFYSHNQKLKVIDLDNEMKQGNIVACVQLLCQTQFRFDEKNMSEMEYHYTIMAINELGASKLFSGMAGYVKKIKMPKELDTLC